MPVESWGSGKLTTEAEENGVSCYLAGHKRLHLAQHVCSGRPTPGPVPVVLQHGDIAVHVSKSGLQEMVEAGNVIQTPVQGPRSIPVQANYAF